MPSFPRRVAIVSDWALPRKGGIETHIQALAKNLRQRGVDATILTSQPGPDEIDGVRIERIDCARLPLAGIAISPTLVRMLRERLAAGGYDIVHIQTSIVAPFCAAAVPAAHSLGLPMVLTFHSVMRTMPSFIAGLDRLTGWTGWNIEMNAVSNRVAREVRRAFPSHEVGILPNGFDHAFWSAQSDDGRSEDRLLIVSAMRLTMRKRPTALVEAFARAAQDNPRLHLVIAGDGPQKSMLERKARKLGIADRISLPGWLPATELRDLYRGGSVFVMPSVKESFCIAALEARAAGLPVIANRNAGIADFVADRLSGLLVDDDAAMARAIARLSGDEKLRARLASNDGGIERYDWAKLAGEHLDLYARRLNATAR